MENFGFSIWVDI